MNQALLGCILMILKSLLSSSYLFTNRMIHGFVGGKALHAMQQHPIGRSEDLNSLIADIGERPVVMLGEASHGTHEFYTWRAAISKKLITEKGFKFITVEGDWPDCYRINRYIKHYHNAGESARDVVMNFKRWPQWMWANWEVIALIEWLQEHNKNLPEQDKVGFYGLDVYSLWDSLDEIMKFIEKADPEAASYVKSAFKCFQPYEGNEHLYAHFSWAGRSCQEQVIRLLQEIRTRAPHWDGDYEDPFSVEQNALIALNAERYYRSMMGFDNESWNVRDRHMMETLDRLIAFHRKSFSSSKVAQEAADPAAVVSMKCIIWAHNTHIGDARATDMKASGMVNLGQLGREEYGVEQVYLVGFGTHSGTVIAG